MPLNVTKPRLYETDFVFIVCFCSDVTALRAATEDTSIGKPGGGPTQCKGSRGHSGDVQSHENGRLQRPTMGPCL